jgi:hypothetical protein
MKVMCVELFPDEAYLRQKYSLMTLIKEPSKAKKVNQIRILISGWCFDRLRGFVLEGVISRIQGEGGGDKEAVDVFLLAVNSGKSERNPKGEFPSWEFGICKVCCLGIIFHEWVRYPTLCVSYCPSTLRS